MKTKTIKAIRKFFDFGQIRLKPEKYSDGRYIKDFTEFSLKNGKKHSSLW